jgi:hypothetical protein
VPCFALFLVPERHFERWICRAAPKLNVTRSHLPESFRSEGGEKLIAFDCDEGWIVCKLDRRVRVK